MGEAFLGGLDLGQRAPLPGLAVNAVALCAVADRFLQNPGQIT